MRGVVLAGGAASRYGGLPKGLLAVGGLRILDRVVATLVEVLGAPPILVANAPEASTWHPGLLCIPDRRPGAGSLGGIYTAVVAADPEPALCVAWDMPFVTAPLLRALIEGSPGFDAFLPESGGRRGVEPLCAVYGPACRAAIERALEREDLRAIAFHDAVRVGTLPLDRVRACGDPDELFFNINRPEDLEGAEALWRRRG
jgi:molybdopterin-guanine dinucleotide biosynthesis protein A